jgi:Fic family protein
MEASAVPDAPQHHGLRTVQNWIGSSDFSPLDADFVPPAPERVEPLMADLVDYLNGAAHAPIVQAAVAHAQFETIHPFTDGNGRVGRALVHTVLARRGLTERAVLPISLVLATLRDRYVAGLTSFRHGEPVDSQEARTAINRWLEVFLDATEIAVEQSSRLMAEVDELRNDWLQRLATRRMATGLRAEPRADSASARLLANLPEAPVATANTLRRILGVTYPAAHAALEELRQAGILQTRSIERGTTAYLAGEVLDLVALAERALASTKFDTRAAAPSRPVPARPAAEL